MKAKTKQKKKREKKCLLFVNISPRQKIALLIPSTLFWWNKVILHAFETLVEILFIKSRVCVLNLE